MPTTRRPDGGLTYTQNVDGKRITTTVVNPSTCKGCAKVWCHTCNQPKCYVRQETEWGPDALATTYGRDFLDKEVPSERVKKVDPYIKSLAKLSDRTTNRADFVPLKPNNVRRTQSARGPLPHRPFDDGTSYKAAHNAKEVPMHIRAVKAVPDYAAPFYGVSSYQADYIKKPIANRPASAPALEVPMPAFDGSTTYRDDFLRKQAPVQPPRVRNALLPSKHTANSTTYGADYIPKPLFRRAADFCCENPHHQASHVELVDRADGRPWTPCCSSCDEREFVSSGRKFPATRPPIYGKRF